MTSQNSNARRFSPIFVATVTPATVSTRTDKSGNKYAYLAGATIAQEGKETKTMTTMAFGKSYAEVGKLLRKGRAVDIDVPFDGGTVKVIGRPRQKVAEAAYAASTAQASTPAGNPRGVLLFTPQYNCTNHNNYP